MSKERVSIYKAAKLREKKKAPERASAYLATKQNRGSDVGYVAKRAGIDFLRVGEGVVDAAAAPVDLITGNVDRAKSRFMDSPVDAMRERLDEEYNPGKVAGFIGDIAGGIGQSVGYGLISAIPYAGKPMMYSSIVEQGISSAAEQTGKVGLKEIGYGATVGAIEGTLESKLGAGVNAVKGIGSAILKKTGLNVAESAAKAGGKSMLKTVLTETAKGFAGEFAEEAISEAVDPALLRLYNIDENAQFSLKDVAYAGIIGGLSGGIMSAGPAAINYRSAVSVGRALQESRLDGELINRAKYTLSALEAAQTRSAGQIKGKSLTAEGDTKETAKEWLSRTSENRRVKRLSKETAQLADKIRRNIAAYENSMKDPAMAQSEPVAAILGELRGNLFLVGYAYEADVIEQVMMAADDKQRQAFVDAINEELAAQGKKHDYTLADFDANKDDIRRGLAGRLMMDELQGDTAEGGAEYGAEATESPAQAATSPWDGMADNEDMSGYKAAGEAEEALLRAAVNQSVPRGSVQAMLDEYRKGADLTPEEFAEGWSDGAHIYGRYGLNVDEASPLSRMSPEAREAAMKFGRETEEAERKAAEEKAKAKKKPAAQAGKKGSVVRGEGLNVQKLSDEQYAAYKAAEVLAEVLGTDIVIETKILTKKGKEANGYYKRGDNTIHININALRNGKNVALYTLGHEITHYIKEWSPQKFEVLADFVLEQMGVDAETAIADKLASLKRLGVVKDTMTVAEANAMAREELVAEGMELVLTDGKVLTELAHTDRSLWQKVKAWIQNIISKIRKYYGNLNQASKTAQVLKETVESLEEIERLFTEGAREAGERTRTAGVETVTRMNEEKMQDSDKTYSFEPADFEKPITLQDIEVLRSIGRKSVNKFSSADIEKAKKWAYKYFKNLNVKSPFFRAWFGEWRAYSKDRVSVVMIPNVAEEKQRSIDGIVCKDTKSDSFEGWKIRISGHGERNTRSHAGSEGRSIEGLTNIKGLVENAILLDTEVHEHHSNNAVNDYIVFDHKLYALGMQENGQIALYKITVEEMWQSKSNTNDMRFHNLKYIEKVADNIGGPEGSYEKNQPVTAGMKSTTGYSIADLYEFVKRFDEEFTPAHEVSELMLDENKRPKTFYHGTNQGDFNEFLWEKTQRADGGFYGRGHYFTSSEGMAKLYGGRMISTYLALKKPFVWRDEVNTWNGRRGTNIVSQNIVARINLARVFPELFADAKIDNWQYDEKAGDYVNKPIKWSELEKMANDIMKEMHIANFADGTYKWFAPGRFFDEGFGDKYSTVEEAEKDKFLVATEVLASRYDGIARSMSFDDQTTYTQQHGDEITALLKKKGYDGAMQDREGTEVVVFDSTSIKSATDNIGIFDSNNPDIRYSIDEDPDGNDNWNRHFEIMARIGELRRRKEAIEHTDDYKSTTESLIKDVMEANGQEEMTRAFERYSEWMTNSEHGKISKEIEVLEKEAQEIYDRKMNQQANKKEPDAYDAREKAIEHFGYTDNFGVAGYILPDGQMLNFSGDKEKGYGTRGEDHRAIGYVFENLKGNAALARFVKDGNIRIIAESPGITISNQTVPSDQQYAKIREFVNAVKSGRAFYVDFMDEKGVNAGSIAYEGTVDETEIIYDIKEFFRTGEVRDRNDDIRYSIDEDPETPDVSETRDLTDREILGMALEGAVQNEDEWKIVKSYREQAAMLELAREKRDGYIKEANALERQIKALRGRMEDEGDPDGWIRKAMDDAIAKKREAERMRDEQVKILDNADRELLRMKAAKPFREIVAREQKRVRAAERRAERAEEVAERKVERARESAEKKITREKERMEEQSKQSRERKEITIRMREARRVLGYLNTMLYHPTKQKHVPESLQALVEKALRSADPKQFGINRDHIREMSELAGKIRNLESKAGRTTAEQETLDKMKTKYEKLEADTISVKRQAEALMTAFEQYVTSTTDGDQIDKNMLEGLRQTVTEIEEAPLNEMTLESLKAVEKIYTVIYHQVNTANQAFATEKAASIDEMSTEANTQVKEAKELKFLSPRSREWAALAGFRSFLWKNMKPLTVFEAIGSNKLMEIFRRVLDAEDVWITDILEAKKALDEAKKEYGYNKWNLKERREITTADGSKVSLTLGEMMSLYAYMFREQAEEHLSAGGFVFAPNAEAIESFKGDKGKYRAHLNDQTTHRMRKEDIAKMSELLTEEQRAYAKAVQEYLTSLGAKGNEVSRKLYGIDLFKETAYFPIKSSHDYIETSTGKSGDPNIKSRGTFKETVPKAGNPIVLEDFMEVVGNHVNTMATYHAFVLPVEDLTRVWNYTPVNIKRDADGKAILDKNGMPVADTEGEAGYNSLKAEITKKYGKEANDYILQLLRDLNGGARRESAASILDKGLTAFKRSATMLSLSTIVQQPTSIIRAMAYVDAKHFTGASFVPWETVKKYAPVAAIKEMGGFDTGTGARTAEYINAKQYDSIKDAAKAAVTPEIYGGDPNVRAEAFGWLTGKADEVSWRYMFGAIVNEQAEKLGKAKDSEEVLKAAGKRFAEVVRRTQVYDSTLTRSEFMRSKDGLMKMATAFGAEPTTVLSMAAEAIVKLERGDKAFFRKTAGAVAASILVNAVISSIIYAMRDDDEEKNILEKYTESVTSEIIEGFNPLEYLPIARDVMSIFKGYDIERTDMSLISNLYQQIELLTSSKRSPADKIAGVSGAVGAFFGLPITNVYRDAKGIVLTTEGILDPEPVTGRGMGNAVGQGIKGQTGLLGKIFGKERGDSYELYQAYVKGDKAHYNRVAARYKTEADLEYALRRELRENDKRIVEAAEAKHSGDLAVYESIVDQIEAEGIFDRNIVIRAINNEVSELKRAAGKGELVPKDELSDENDDEETAESLYKSSDLNAALERGDAEDFNAILAALVEDKVSTGKTEAQAKASVKSAITAYWKKQYLSGYQDTETRKRIIKLLTDTGLYGSRNDVAIMCENWVKASASK